MNKLIIREDIEHGYVATLHRVSHGEKTEIKTRSLKYLQLVARNNKAEIIPRRFRL